MTLVDELLGGTTPPSPAPQPTAPHPTIVACEGGRPGRWEGDWWIEPDGYRVERKWVEKYPHLYGPCATDPDHGLGDVELGKDDLLASAFAKISGIGGMFSTSAEQHCFETAATLANLFVESSADIPPVPVFWIGEGHYWMTGIVFGRALKKKAVCDAQNTDLLGQLSKAIPWKQVAAAIVAAVAGGAIAVPPLAQAILKILAGGSPV